MSINILGVKISSKDKSWVLKKLGQRLENGKKTVVFTPNPEIVLMASKDSNYKEILNKADINVADGIGLVYASHFLLKHDLPRIPGRELMLDILSLANSRKLKIYFLGASKEVNTSSIKKASKLYPDLEISGSYVPLIDIKGYLANESDTSIYNEILSDIKKIKPDILFVALGAPKQERWIINNLDLPVKILMAVGGSLDYFSERASLPPSFLSRLGLEWIWRGLHEPKRFKRIFNATILFPLKVLTSK